jgi:homoserine/homoserine lactone efflux protein
MDIGLLMIYFPLALVSTLLPGPSATLALSHGAAHGAWGAWPTIVGVNVAVLAMMVLSYTGVGSLASGQQDVFNVYRVVCTAVLIWIAWGMWQSKEQAPDVQADKAMTASSSNRAHMFFRGFLVSASNPKALGFFFLIFPGFIAASGSGVWQFSVLALIWLLCETVGLAVYAASGPRLLGWLSDRGGFKRLNRLCAVLMLLMTLGMWILPAGFNHAR